MKALTVAGFEECATGGGCMALIKELPDGGHLLLTAEDGADVPSVEDETILCGRYDMHGECVGGEAVDIKAANLAQWIASQS